MSNIDSVLEELTNASNATSIVAVAYGDPEVEAVINALLSQGPVQWTNDRFVEASLAHVSKGTVPAESLIRSAIEYGARIMFATAKIKGSDPRKSDHEPASVDPLSAEDLEPIFNGPDNDGQPVPSGSADY